MLGWRKKIFQKQMWNFLSNQNYIWRGGARPPGREHSSCTEATFGLVSHRRTVAEARESFPARARAWNDVETSRACNESDRGHQPLPLIPKSCGAAADPNFLNRDEISTVSLKTLSKLIALAFVTFPKIFRYQNQTIAVWIYLFGLTQNFGRLFLSDSSPIIVYLCPKYFHSLDSQNQIIFNSSQTFKTHPSTSLLKGLASYC